MHVEAGHPGRTIRTRDAIEQTTFVLVGTLVEPGTPSPGPPGAHRIDEARFRVEQVLTPSTGAPPPSGTFALSYIRQVFPEPVAEAEPQRGGRYVLFCTLKAGQRLHALKVVPHSEEAVRVVASAFGGGARHAGGDSGDRLA